MISSVNDILTIVKSKELTPQQKLIALGNTSERIFSPVDLLGYTEEELSFLENQMVCDLNEGYALYRPRYIVPNYEVFVKNGVQFLELDPPTDLDELLDGLLILYTHVPSITSFPVFIGHLDRLMEPFITDNEEDDYKKIKRFLK